jgi:hypothetical protein
MSTDWIYRTCRINQHMPYVNVNEKDFPKYLASFASDQVEFNEEFTSFVKTECVDCKNFHCGLSFYEYQKWHTDQVALLDYETVESLDIGWYSSPWIDNKVERDSKITKIQNRYKRRKDKKCLAFACYKLKFSDFPLSEYCIIMDADYICQDYFKYPPCVTFSFK